MPRIPPPGTDTHRPDCACFVCVRARDKQAGLPPSPSGPQAPNQKQVRLAEIVVNGLASGSPVSASEALVKAGYHKSALKDPEQVFGTESFRVQAVKIAEKKGVTLSFLFAGLKLLCRATRSIYMKDKDGEIVKFTEPDNLARAKGVETGLKFYDVFPKEEKHEGTTIVIQSSAILTPGHKKHCTCSECAAELEQLAERCRAQIRERHEAKK